MIKNYFKIAWRNLMRHKAYSGINIFGLALGIASCLLILQYVSYQLSYENFQVNKDRIYRIQQDRYDNGKLSTQWAAGAFGVGHAFKDAIPSSIDPIIAIYTITMLFFVSFFTFLQLLHSTCPAHMQQNQWFQRKFGS